MSKGKKLNGSVDLLAQAMKKVFSEAVEGAVTPLTTEVKTLRGEMHGMRDEMHGMEGRMEERLAKGLKTTNENVQAQLAQNREDIRNDVKDALAKR